MNKKRNIAMSIIAAGALALSMTAGCHTHTYSTSWSSDSTQHWHDATCGHDVTSDAANHTYTSSVTTAATCTTDGVTTYTCTVCGYSYTAPISATGHDYEAAYEWNTDGTVKSLTLTCKNDSTHVVEVAVSDVTVTEDDSKAVAAEAYKPGIAAEYTASYTYDGVTYTDTYSTSTPATGEDYTITVNAPFNFDRYLDSIYMPLSWKVENGVVYYQNASGTYVTADQLVQGTDYTSISTSLKEKSDPGVESFDFTAPADGTYTFTVTADSYGYVRINDSEYDVNETIGNGYSSYTCTVENVTGGDVLSIMATVTDDTTLYTATTYTYTLHVGYEGDGTSSSGGSGSGETAETTITSGTTYSIDLDSTTTSSTGTMTITEAGYYTVTLSSNTYINIYDDNDTYYYNSYRATDNYITDEDGNPVSIPANTVLNYTIGLIDIDTATTATVLVAKDSTYTPPVTTYDYTLTSSGLTQALTNSDGTTTGTEYTVYVEDGNVYTIAISGDSDSNVGIAINNETTWYYNGDAVTLAFADEDTFSIFVAGDATVTISVPTVTAGTTFTATLDTDAYYFGSTLTVTEAGYYKVTFTGTSSYVYIYDSSYTYYYNSSNCTLGYIIDWDANDETVISVPANTVLYVSISYYGYTSADVSLLVELDADYEPSTSSGDTDTYDYTLTGSTFTANLTGSNDEWNPITYEIYVSVAGTYTFAVDENGNITVEANSNGSSSIDDGGSDSFTVAVGDIITVNAYADTTLTVTSIVTLGDNTIKITETDSDGNSVTVTKTFTAETAGLYTFSIESGTDADIYVGDVSTSNVFYCSDSYCSLSTSCYLAVGDTISIEFNTWNSDTGEYTFTIAAGTITEDELTIGETTDLTMVNSADSKVEYVFLTLTTGTLTDTSFYIQFGCSSSSSKGYITAVEVTINDTAYTVEDLICNNITLASDTTYSIVVKFTASSFSSIATYTAKLAAGTYVPVTTSVNSETDSEKYALVEGTNNIALSNTDANSGVAITYTATGTGIYTFEIVSSEGAKVTVATTTLQVTNYSSNLTYSAYLEKDATISLTLKTYSGAEGSYTLKITKSDPVYEALTLGTTESTTAVTKYTNGASSSSSTVNYIFVSYTVPSDATATAYYIALTGSSSYWNSSLSEDDVTISVNGATAVASTDYIFNNLTLTAGETYNFTIVINSSSSYNMYVSLYEGTYVPLTTSINGSATGTLTTGTSGNAIVLSGSDASSGYALTFTAEADGVYTFTVDENEDAEVYIAESQSAYESNSCTSIYCYSTTYSVVLEKDDTLYIVLKSYSEGEASYTLTITTGSITTATVTTEETELTLYSSLTDSYTYTAYATITTDASTSGEYHIEITSTNRYFSRVTVAAAVNGTSVTVEDGSFNITLEASTTYNIVVTFEGYSVYPSSYSYYAQLVSGSVTLSSVPTTLSTATSGNLVTIVNDTSASSGIDAEYTLAAGNYTISISDTESGYIAIYTADYSVYSSIYASGTTSYEFSLSDETVVYITYYTDTYQAASYYVYLSVE